METRPLQKQAASASRPFSAIAILVICSVSLLFALGAVMVFGTSSAILLDRIDFSYTYRVFLRQLAYAMMGCFLAYTTFRFGYKSFMRASPQLLAAITICLVLCYVPGFKRPYNGANRWFGLGGFSFQPSEFAKLIIPAYLIQYICGAGGSAQESMKSRFVRACLTALPALLLIWSAPDNRTTLLVVSTSAVAFALMLIPLRLWLAPLCALSLIGGAMALQLPYVQNRLKAYFEPDRDLRGRAHQPHQARIAAGSGGVWGVGLGRSLQKYRYLPEAQNDYIAAIFAEELGFLGALTLICLYASLTLWCWRLSISCPEARGRELGCTLTFSLGIQGFINLGVVSGLLPSTGLNLPFFSQGGTSLCANFTAIALLISIGEGGSGAKARPRSTIRR